jgi:hypothetical protein
MLRALGVPRSAKDDESIKAIPELVFWRHTAIDQVGNLFVEVLADLILKARHSDDAGKTNVRADS